VAFKLRLLEADTGILLNQAGKRHLRGQPGFEPTFESEAEAARMTDELLRLFPWAEVLIHDGDRYSTFHASAPMRARFEALRSKYFRYYTSFPLVRLVLTAPIDPWDPSSYA
jgi:hypothetical protein